MKITPTQVISKLKNFCRQDTGIVTTMDTYETRGRNRYSNPVMSFGKGTVATRVPERPVSDAVPSGEVWKRSHTPRRSRKRPSPKTSLDYFLN